MSEPAPPVAVQAIRLSLADIDARLEEIYAQWPRLRDYYEAERRSGGHGRILCNCEADAYDEAYSLRWLAGVKT